MFKSILIGCLVFLIYFGFGTRWTFKIDQELDHYNSLAQAFRHGRLDIRNSPITDELSFFDGKWYPYYGPIPAIPLAFLQIISGKEFIPTLYTNVFIASLGIVATYWMLLVFKTNFFPKGTFSPAIISLTVAFGSVLFGVAIHSGIWFQAQTYTYLFTVLGLIPLLAKRFSLTRMYLSTFFLSLNLFTRPHTVLLMLVPPAFWLLNVKDLKRRTKDLAGVLWLPAIILLIFFGYNFARFGNILETGVTYQRFHYQFAHRLAQTGGWFSLKNVPYNLWFMTMEIPKLTWENGFTNLSKIKLAVNPEGNSIFFMTPILLAVFLALPWKTAAPGLKRLSWALWLGTLAALFPVLLLTGTGWQQIGYRYTLDVTAPLVMLSLIGIRGKPNLLYHLGIIFSVWIWTMTF